MPEGIRKTAGFNPPRKEGRYTVSELTSLKQLLSDSGLSFWIKAAGLGALVETAHIAWLAARYIWRF